MFFASGLDEAPAGQTYQGWLINSETDIRSAGLFQANADGTAVLVVSGDPGGAGVCHHAGTGRWLRPADRSPTAAAVPRRPELEPQPSRSMMAAKRLGRLPRERWLVEAAAGGAPTRVPR